MLIGVECVKSLYFGAWNTRRDQIQEAEIGTNEWVWHHPLYKQWEQANSGILWVEGKPGSGKSVLAKSIQKGLAPTLPRRATDLSASDAPLTYAAASLCSTRFVRSVMPLVGDWYYSTRHGEEGMSHAVHSISNSWPRYGAISLLYSIVSRGTTR